MNKELWLFTIRFPFGNGESFLENELPVLARGFSKVRVFPLMPEGAQRSVPANVEVVRIFGDDAFRTVSPLRVLSDLRSWNEVMRVSKMSAPSEAVFSKHRRTLMSSLRQAMYREGMLSARMASSYDPRKVTLYSYWTSDWATVLGLWKLHDPQVRFVSRMMGFDMFDHRAADDWQMLQAFHIKQVDRVFTISKAGLDHISARFPEAAEKFSISHLATNDHGRGPWLPAEELRIVSCANLIPLKRVHVIADALKNLDTPVRWTHFGDGVERARIEAIVKTLPPNVSVELKGNVPNAEIIAWYKANATDVFVHASETEGGAPVALQEAASFGIPLIAADAGGVHEIVTSRTGELLPHAITSEILAEKLRTFKATRWYTIAARKEVRAFWAANFNAEEVHGKLLNELLA